MANLLNEKISSNYRGILNLGDTINQPLSGTIQSITDGMGNASPLSLSTTIVGIGRTGVDGLVNWRRSSDGNSVAAMGVRPGFSDWYFEGNNVNFRTNSTGFFFGGGSTWVNPTARLHVRGDGTNPILRAEDNSGTANLLVYNNYILIGGSTPFGPHVYAMNGTTFTSNNAGISLGFYNRNTIASTTSSYDFGFGGDDVAATLGTRSHVALVRTFSAGAGAANFRPLSIEYTINNSGAQTGTATGIYLNATETNLNGMNHNLLDLQVGGVSQIRANSEALYSLKAYYIGASLGTTAGMSAVTPENSSSPSAFNMALRLEDFRNAGLSGYSYFLFSSQYVNLSYTTGEGGYLNLGRGFAPTSGNGIFNAFIITNTINQTGGANGISRGLYVAPILTSAADYRGIEVELPGQNVLIGRNASSALIQMDSTTKGFLLPRMTTAQRDAIASPAAGLMIYNTTTNKLNVFTTTWEQVTSA